MSELDGIFGANGTLAAILPNYAPRSAQSAMAQAVAEAIASQRSLIAEAGTGTGKTFAYLIPALLSGKKVIVSTGTRNLQDQLFEKDLPIVRQVLGLPFQAALLKGRSNYLCHYRLGNVLGFRAGHTNEDAADLENLIRWSKITRTGDIAEVVDVPETSGLWRSATSTTENCLGQECPDFSRCCPAAARKRALDADIVIVNHHLVWADWVLKIDGFGELLPKAEVVVVDEAHQFAESASQFLGMSITSRQVEELTQDIRLELAKQPGELPSILQEASRLDASCTALRDALGSRTERQPWSSANLAEGTLERLREMSTGLADLAAALSELSGTYGRGLDSCRQRTDDLQYRLREFESSTDAASVRWFEAHRHGFRLNQTPIDIDDDFRDLYGGGAASWIFTSATLSNAGCFDHFKVTLGLSEVETFCSESPFDYEKQCLLYVPPNLPDPANAGHTAAVVAASVEVFAASGGRGFFLFTSHQALNTAAHLLRQHCDFPLFVQGMRPKSALLELFKRSGDGILLGTASFWEGVDVRGPELSCVVIDKLPFASPSDPVLGARIAALKERGVEPFRNLQLPSAVLALKQGAGRLIRDADDRGVLMIGDPRLFTRPYGKVFLANLPRARITRSVDDVNEFFGKPSRNSMEKGSTA